MGRDLSARWPEVFRALDAETLRLRSQLAPGAGWDDAGVPEFEDQRAPIMGQVVLGTAVADLLETLGVRPDAVIGYSLGESSALLATRAWPDRDEIHARLDASPLFRTDLAGPCDAARRAWGLLADEPTDWVAGIVPYPAEAVRAALAEIPHAYLLIINTPRESVVGGRRGAVKRLAAALGGKFLPLPMVSTVHCEVARQVEHAYRDLHLLKTTPPAGVRFYGAARGEAYVPDRASAAEAIVGLAVDTVDFPAVIRRAHDDGIRVFVEVGPGASCSRMIRATLRDRPHLAASACVAGADAVVTLLDLLGRLIAERVPVDLAPFYGRETRALGPRPADRDDGPRDRPSPSAVDRSSRPKPPVRSRPRPERPSHRDRTHPIASPANGTSSQGRASRSPDGPPPTVPEHHVAPSARRRDGVRPARPPGARHRDEPRRRARDVLARLGRTGADPLEPPRLSDGPDRGADGRPHAGRGPPAAVVRRARARGSTATSALSSPSVRSPRCSARRSRRSTPTRRGSACPTSP